MNKIYKAFAILVFLSGGTVSAQYRDGVDLISLHYDFAPDKDDGHSSVAAMTLLGALNIKPLVVTGALGDGNRSSWISGAPGFQDQIWGAGGHVNAMGNWNSSVSNVAKVWRDAISKGGVVYVAEGGQSDFTSDVLRSLQAGGGYNRSSVVVVQHSVWNEQKANQGDLAFVKNNSSYIKIADGNGGGATADLNQQSSSFVNWARNGPNSREWNEAFRFLNPTNKLDFSDTVELLHILGIGRNQISSPDTFANYVDNASGGAGGNGGSVTGGGTGGSGSNNGAVILVEAEDFSSKGSGWTIMNTHGGGSGSYLELLPDTRVTHSDPLIPGQNFWDTPGTGPKITYDVDFPSAGQYRVEVSAYSTGSEDNGIHVGINGNWPASGARMQWCTGKNSWTWSSAQRTASNHCGTANSISINVPSVGKHQVMFSAREDGFEMDQFRLTSLSGSQTGTGGGGTFTYNDGSSIGGNTDGSSTLYTNVAVDEIGGAGPGVESLSVGVTANDCVVAGKTLDLAKLEYSAQCGLARVDCDPHNGEWLCASFKIGVGAPGSPSGVAGSGSEYQMETVFLESDANNTDYTATEYYDVCQYALTDESGDGYGWQNDDVCVVTRESRDLHSDAFRFVSCLSPENTINRQGTNADGEACVVTNETVGVEIGVATRNARTGGDSIADNVGELGGNDFDPTILPVFENNGRDDAVALAGRVVNFASGLSDSKTVWSDSYSVAGQCYCDSNFDHGLSGIVVGTPKGSKSVPVVCADIQARHGTGPSSGRTYFNDIQCGNGPANTAPDEAVCPGIPIGTGNYTGPNCDAKGSTWNLDLLYADPVVVANSTVRTGVNSTGSAWWKPAASDNLSWQLQLQGDVKIIPGVDVYAVDYSVSSGSIAAAKATGAKLMCYISAGSAENWRGDFGQFPKSVIGNAYDGWPGEWWLDTRDIDALAPIMRARMDACKAKGFDVIDTDNINGYENNTGFNISRAESIRYIKWLAKEAHQRGMSFSLKNSESLIPDVINDVDMMQSESCVKYGNCTAAAKMSAANKPVFAVEYAEVLGSGGWSRACSIASQYNFSMIYRDLLLTPNGEYRTCSNGGSASLQGTQTGQLTTVAANIPATALSTNTGNVLYKGLSPAEWNKISSAAGRFGDSNNCRARITSIPTSGHTISACSGNCINNALNAHKVVILKSGTYKVNGTINIPHGKTLLGVSGTGVVIDASNADIAIRVNSGSNLANLTVVNAQNEGIRMGDNTNITQVSVKNTGRSSVSNSGGSGFFGYNRTGNCVVSTEALNGYNEDGQGCAVCANGGNADGYKFTFGSGSNTLIDAHASGNSDDGFDFWKSTGSNFVYYSSSTRNGTNAGDGNGYKLGIGSAKHYLYESEANDNRRNGFDINGNTITPLAVNSTASGNARDWVNVARDTWN